MTDEANLPVLLVVVLRLLQRRAGLGRRRLRRFPLVHRVSLPETFLISLMTSGLI